MLFSTMLLAIDIGNTNSVFALFDTNGQGVPVFVWRCRTDAARTADEYAAFLSPLLLQQNIAFAAIKNVLIASVVPDADFNIGKLCREWLHVDPRFVTASDCGVPVKLDRPEEAGADRLVNAVAVLKDYRAPAIVIDFGTATTFDVINGVGEFCGGVIAPGVNLSMEALHRAAARLPKIRIQKPDHAIGRGTVAAMQSGLYWGYVGMIEGLLTRITAELNEKEKPFILATGGLATLFADAIPMIDAIDDDLTLKGLWHIYRSNECSKKV